MSCGLLISCEEACFVGEYDCLDSVAEVELLEDVRDVCLHGRVADVELLADLRVGEAARDQAKHIQLAVGQLSEFSGRFWVRDASELLDHALRDRRRVKRFSGGDD